MKSLLKLFDGFNAQGWRLPIMACLMCGGGLVVSITVHRLMLRGERSLGWPSTESTIVRAVIEPEVGNGLKPEKKKMVARITYAYQVQGKVFEHTWVESLNPQAAAQEFPVGRKLKIYYDPLVVEDVTFSTGVSDFTRSMRLWAGLVGCLGMVMLVMLIRQTLRSAA